LDLWQETPDQTEMEFENEGGETYICGNPPYVGKGKKSCQQIDDMEFVFAFQKVKHGYVDYVGCWFMKAADYGLATKSSCAFVATNSICQGHQAPIIWQLIIDKGYKITFAHTSFKWSNLASNNAGVTVVIIGLSREKQESCKLFTISDKGTTLVRDTPNINAYLVSGSNIFVQKRSSPLSDLPLMDLGNMPYDGGNLLLSTNELNQLGISKTQCSKFIRRIYGSAEFIKGLSRYCLWIENENLDEALTVETIRIRIEKVRKMRLESRDKSANDMAKRSHQMREMNISEYSTITIPRTSSENRPFLPTGFIDRYSTVSSEAFAIFDAPLWNMALIASRLHLVWIATVCGKLETRYRYSNTLGWNTFPVPTLTDQNKTDLTRCAEEILLAREHYFPATIADMYDPVRMDSEFPLVREAHERNDETIERIYIGRRFKHDTDRLEKLFEMYTKMTSKPETGKKTTKRKTKP